jgi:membrane protease YdiL (CAAX protease family)
MIAAIMQQPLAGALVLPVLLAEELVFRGIVQRGIEEALDRRTGRVIAAVASVLLAVVAGGEAGAPPLGVVLAVHAAAALTRAITGRWSAAFLARIAATVAALALARAGL